MLEEIKISVVCPTYNSEKFIYNSLETVFIQKEKPYEVIVVDDGSIDNTINELEFIQKKFLKNKINFSIIKNKHRGPGNTRNTGIKFAKGNWVAFLDSDDTWSDNKIQKVKEAIEKHPNSNFILHWEKLINNDKEYILQHGINYDKNKTLEGQLFNNNFISTSAVTCSINLLRNNLFDEYLRVSQDYELWLRLSPILSLHIIPEVLGNYIIREGSITSKPYIVRIYYLFKILIRHRNKSSYIYLFLRIFRSIITKQWIK